jgi:hypothetical protein
MRKKREGKGSRRRKEWKGSAWWRDEHWAEGGKSSLVGMISHPRTVKCSKTV